MQRGREPLQSDRLFSLMPVSMERLRPPMPALPQKADMCGALAYVCFGPKADICNNDMCALPLKADIRPSSCAVTFASVRELFSPLWPPPPCSQKRRTSILPAQLYRDSKSPNAKA